LPEFHNPYNFVNTPSRAEILDDPVVGDYDPSDDAREENHSRYWPDRYTGVIPVRLRTRTPLFITAPNSKNNQDGHRTCDCLDHIPATALKGMLSAAYEIITNSRYRVFHQKQHEKKLGFRYQAEATLVPGRVENNNGAWTITLFTGTSTIGPGGQANGPLYAAWLPCYDGAGNDLRESLQNGQFYKNVTLRRCNYQRNNIQFQFWSVERIGTEACSLLTHNAQRTDETQTVEGYAVKSGKIFPRKHDERFFFNINPPVTLNLNKEVRCRYEGLVADYQRVHEDGSNPPIGNVRQGAHITDPEQRELRDGCFVYAKTNGQAVEAIYPVQISRELNEAAPWDCLDQTLRPAESPDRLSPADRLFGWVAQKGSGAWKGKVRVGDGIYKSRDDNDRPVTLFNEPMPLSILGAPKPAQARFYLGDGEGNPQPQGLSKTAVGYRTGKKLRGRKVYLHHCLLHLSKEERRNYWDPQQGMNLNPLPEYRQLPGENERTNQNRSLKGWIEPRKDFFFDIKVENLTREELGGILTLLSLEGRQCCFRLGYGKPLGLGSVALSFASPEGNLMLFTGNEMAERYGSCGESAGAGMTPLQRDRVIQDYRKAMAHAYGHENIEMPEPDLSSWRQLPFTELLDDAALREYEKVWNEALGRDEENVPFDQLPSKDELEELFPDLKGDLDAVYKELLKNIRAQRNNDYGWGNLSFIDDFIKSMQGFDNAPVAYPRNFQSRNEEGFKWFVENERETNHRPAGYPLPPIGDTLSGFAL
jgi:CRISPR-associated protein (TIGR03986 family)